jgi:hypothetical protein
MSLPTLDAELYAESVKALRDLVVAVMPSYTYGAFEGLVHRFKPGADGIHYKWIVTPLAAIERDGTDEAGILSRCLQWASYDTKLNMRDADFSEELSLEYLHDEYVMSHFTYDRGLVAAMRDVVTEWSERMTTIPETAPWHFRHGNGATVEVSRANASPLRKSDYFAITADDEAYLAWRGACEGLNYQDLTWCGYRAEETPIVVDFVPKSPLTNRVISKEHVTKMWLQNDLFWLMDRMFRESGVPVHLHNQDASRQLALEGSVDGRYDTFDYSKASDFVTNSLVSGITRGTWLHDPLQWSRSKTVTVGRPSKSRVGLEGFCRIFGDAQVTIPLAKFAPMGSSTCFPTESLAFASLCEVAIRQVLHRKSRPGDYLVYGDDVVIRSDCSDELRFLSALLHFKVNDSKTCRETGRYNYREACGIEAINGIDVTPLRVSRRYVGIVNAIDSTATTPGEFVGIVDFINRTFLSGLANLRKFLCSMLTLWPRYYEILRVSHSAYSRAERRWRAGLQTDICLPTPFFLTDDACDTNYRCSQRFRLEGDRRPATPNFQELEVKVWMVSARKQSHWPVWGPTGLVPSHRGRGWTWWADDIAYWLWLLQAQTRDSRASRSDSDFLEVVERQAVTGSAPLRWVRKWITLF